MFAIFVFINCWLIALPLIQKRTIMKSWMSKCYYIMKCFYLFVSGWQVYKGYVTLTMSYFEKQTYGVISRIMNKLFVLIPFLFELTTTVDWVATDSALGFHDFYNMENVYNIIYNLKCRVTWESIILTQSAQLKANGANVLSECHFYC
uniref:Piezo non-specific cation channel R-Ras-binding domain-containing protein n=1 Tax=Ditylenchus dipsaci TaxID=166011 RepID=A0A915CNU1_9BILA